jgi:hypothetical protein
MGSWNGILIVLGCAAAGLIIGILLIYVFQRIKKKQVNIFQKEADFIKSEAPKSPLTTTLNNGTIKSNGHEEDLLEVLIKNHKNGTIAADQKQSTIKDVPRVFETSKPNGTPLVEKKEQHPQPDVIHWTELFKQGNTVPINEESKIYKPLAPQEPAIVNQKNTLVAEEHKAPSLPSIPTIPEITNQKITPVERRQKKLPKLGALKKTEILNPKNNAVVREQKKSPKSITPQEPEVIKQKSTSIVEEHKKSSESSIPRVPETTSQKSIPAVEKPKESPKSDFIKELETNLAIATATWADKLLPFQTSCWDANHGESEPLLTAHHQDLIQLYVDIGLANNIVWLSTEIGHRSKELDESYIRLCAGIAERLKRVVPSLNGRI